MIKKVLLTAIMAFILIFSISASVPVTITASGTASICPGASASLSAVASGGTGGPYTFFWMPGSLSGSTISVSPASTTTYTVTATDGAAGTGTATVTVTVLPLPLVSFSSNIASGCASLCVGFTDASTISSGTIVAWSWNFGDANTANSQNPSNCYNIPGSYTASLTAISSSGCAATYTNVNMISVYPYPTANFSTSLSPPNTINFTDLSIAASSWSWDFGDGNNSTLQNPVHTYASPGNYTVTLIVQNSFGCSDTVTIVIVVTGINEYYLNDIISISPNPLNTSSVIEFKNTNLNLLNANILLFDVLGKEIKKIEIGNYKTTIEKGELNPGIYFYQVINQNQLISTGKLVVE